MPNSSEPAPASSESAPVSSESYLFSVDEFLSNYVTDTTGLRDKCITREDYCTVVAQDWGYRENAPVYGAVPCGVISGPTGDNFPEYKGQNCALDEPADNLWKNTVGAIVDETYIEQLAAHNDDVREKAINEFDQIEASMDSCDL